jgi:hypothetical protein
MVWSGVEASICLPMPRPMRLQPVNANVTTATIIKAKLDIILLVIMVSSLKLASTMLNQRFYFSVFASTAPLHLVVMRMAPSL